MPTAKLHLIPQAGAYTTLCGRLTSAVGGIPYHAMMTSPANAPGDAYCRMCVASLNIQEERRIYQENRLNAATYDRHQYLPVDAQMLTVPQAAELMGLSVPRVRFLAASNRLAGARRPGRDWLIPRTSAEAYQPKPAGNPTWRRSSTGGA
jgi:excisionase family DNA binding protein